MSFGKISFILLIFTLICCTLQFNNNVIAIHESQSLPLPPITLTGPDVSGSTSQQPEVQITSHFSGQTVPVGSLTISGTSTDTSSRECQVYTDLNDKKPFQRVVATGSGGPNDFSTWTFTYNDGYQLIQNGTNNLTSKIICMDSPTSTKWHSVNITGVNGLASSASPLPITQAQTADPQADGFVTPFSTLNLPAPLGPVTDEEEDNDLVNLFDSSDEEEEDEGETETSDDSAGEDEEDDDGDRERCPNGYHRSPSGNCERVRDLPDDLPRCPNGFHRSPDGDCEAVRD
ncbi:hypothetical protein BH18THE2_BH18THE2_22340 [soil metagenome]